MTATYLSPILAGEEYLIALGSGSPLVYTASVLANADRTIGGKAAVNTADQPRTDTPSAPAQVRRLVKSVDWTLSGSGMMQAGLEVAWAGYLNAGVPLAIQFGPTAHTGAQGGWTGQGSFVLTSFEVTGRQHDYVTVKFTLEQDGTPTFTANA